MIASAFMSQPPPLGRIVRFPLIAATVIAVLIATLAPRLGPMAYLSAWIGSFFVLTVWGIITYERDK